MKVIYIIGEPGSGKSTLMKRLMTACNIGPDILTESEFPLVPFHYHDGVAVIGKYVEGDKFPGSDKTSMAIQPQAIEWLKNRKDDELVVLCEGDRLTTASFMEHIVEEYDACIYYLRTSEETRKQRYKERGSEQNETWLAGRLTKINNILSNFTLMNNIRKFDNNTIEDQDKVFMCILKEME